MSLIYSLSANMLHDSLQKDIWRRLCPYKLITSFYKYFFGKLFFSYVTTKIYIKKSFSDKLIFWNDFIVRLLSFFFKVFMFRKEKKKVSNSEREMINVTHGLKYMVGGLVFISFVVTLESRVWCEMVVLIAIKGWFRSNSSCWWWMIDIMCFYSISFLLLLRIRRRFMTWLEIVLSGVNIHWWAYFRIFSTISF